MNIGILKHFWQMTVFAIVLMGPVPFSLFFINLDNYETKKYSFAHNILVLLISWFVIQTIMALVFGVIGFLNLISVVVFQFVIFLLGIKCYKSTEQFKPRFFVRDIAKVISSLNSSELLILASFFAICTTFLWRIIAAPIIEYDSLAYHLPAMVEWYQTSFVRFGPRTFPGNFELISTLFLMPFGEDLFAAFPNLISWFLLALSVFCLAIEIGAKKIYALASSIFVLFTPRMIETLGGAQVDIYFAALFMASLYFIYLYSKGGSYVQLALFIVCLAMLLGTKTTGLLYGALLGFILCIAVFQRIIRRQTTVRYRNELKKSVIIFFMIVLFCSFFMAGFWYVLNLIKYGNPLGIYEIKLGNFVLFAGTRSLATLKATSLANLFNPLEFSDWVMLFTGVGKNFQLPFFIMSLVFMVSFIKSLVFSRNQSLEKKLLHPTLLLLFLSIGLIYWHIPWSGGPGTTLGPAGWIGQELRLCFPLLGILGVAAAISLDNLKVNNKIITMTVIVFGIFEIAYTNLWQRVAFKDVLRGRGLNQAVGESIIFLILFALVTALLFWWRKKIDIVLKANLSLHRLSKPILLFVFLFFFCGITFSYIAREVRNVQRKDAYGGILEFIELYTDKNRAIGTIFSHRPYLLYGKNLDRKVLHVDRKTESLSEWLNFLNSHNVSFVGAGPLVVEKEREEMRKRVVSWLEDRNGAFIRVFGEDPEKELVLYKVK
ncbi:MAG: phospholipid carrier-dependent glycosyltransferase [Candidatus Omnitrophota bacterium]|nr:MAG: phospholipid carrier-dependent glycosyltransferase [Candidatus Omnitrophota bacterium]